MTKIIDTRTETTKTTGMKLAALKNAVDQHFKDKDVEVRWIERYDEEAGDYVGAWTIRNHNWDLTLQDAEKAVEELRDAMALVRNIEEWNLEEVEEGTCEEYRNTFAAILDIMEDGDWAAIWSVMK